VESLCSLGVCARLTLWRDSSFRCSSRANTPTAPAKVLDPELRALAELAALPPGEFLELIEGESVMRALARL
jgi:hypothetical protein